MTPKVKVSYPAPEEFECNGLRDILRSHTKAKHTRLPIGRIRKNTYDRGQSRARRVAFIERATRVAEAIKESGELDAILVARHTDGYWVCLDGHHRLEACKMLKMTKIPVVALE